VRQTGSALSPEKICFIHNIAVSRLQKSPDAASRELLQLLIQATAGRIRSWAVRPL